MKILVPVNKATEVEELAKAGADEIYCGVFPKAWKEKYTNIVSPNRREWTAANLPDFQVLRETVAVAHANNVRVLFTLNALYTTPQYPLLYEQLDQAKKAGVDALIVADLGLLLALKQANYGFEIHMSTGGTTFNSETAKFYEELGVKRITIPRHMKPEEIGVMLRNCPSLQFEVFIMNSGCKNIDGFCTFLHGTSELKYGCVWKYLKKLNFDRFILRQMRKNAKLMKMLRFSFAGVDSPCLKRYETTLINENCQDPGKAERVKTNLLPQFDHLSGAADPCGACAIALFEKMGVYGVKIVGRNYSTSRKITDVKFIKAVSALAGNGVQGQKEQALIRQLYRQVYGMDCGKVCYYPYD